MRDQNQVASQLLPSGHQTRPLVVQPILGEDCNKRQGALFMENWPAPPKCEDEQQMDDLMRLEVLKWRLQTLLAVQPFGVPSLALAQTYENMFGMPFSLRDFGCDNLIPELANKMADILVIQEPDETTPVLFPQYPNDRILHDARLGHDFSKLNLDGDSTFDLLAEGPSTKTGDPNDLILRAWLDRDIDFPEDVVLPGEPYDELCKVALATMPGTRGLYRATIVSLGNPDSVFIQLKTTDEVLERIHGLSAEIVEYFRKTTHPIDAYNVPEHFISLNFPCLFYSAMDRSWTRCIIVGRSRGDNKVLVESIDFGGIYAINKIFLYLMPRMFLNIPRLTFEVSLAGIKPSNGTTWSKTAGARLRCFSIPNYYLDVLLIDLKPTARKAQSSTTSESRDKQAASSLTSLPSRDTPTSESIKPTGKGLPGEMNDCSGSQFEGIARLSEQKTKRLANRAVYSAIIVDRNAEDTDIYLNDVLTLETYASEDLAQVKRLEPIRIQLVRALEGIPRPTNPLGPMPYEDV